MASIAVERCGDLGAFTFLRPFRSPVHNKILTLYDVHQFGGLAWPELEVADMFSVPYTVRL